MSNQALDKNVRYDRQLRLWGQWGQDQLQKSKIAVLSSSSTSAEVMKNLVLPGIGSFTIIDDAKVTNADLGNNFFVDEESLGKSRAETVTNLLKEMNPFVDGNVVEENCHSIINERVDFFGGFTMVVADSVREPELKKLAAFLWEKQIPLVITRSYGFIGYLRLVVPEHGVVESHPPETFDLRIQDPWKELQEYMDSVDLELKDEGEADRVKAHSHIPWLVLVFRFAQKYKKDHDGKECPRKEFPAYVKDQRIDNSKTGGKYVEENFDEATKNGWRVFSKYNIPSSVKAIINDPAAQVTAKSNQFWFLVAALKRFVEKEGEGKFLPLVGGIPDMHSSTNNYIALQKVYQAKAEKDVDALMKHLDAVASEVGIKEEVASRDDVKRFCKNAGNLRLIRYLPYEGKPDIDELSEMVNDEDQPEGKNILWYLLIVATAAFETKHARLPGDVDANVAGDVPLLKAEFEAVVKDYGISFSDNIKSQVDDHVSEMVRYGGSEMHNIAAFNGGVTSLEIIKLVTHQWVPLSNVFIFNGINGTAVSF